MSTVGEEQREEFLKKILKSMGVDIKMVSDKCLILTSESQQMLQSLKDAMCDGKIWEWKDIEFSVDYARPTLQSATITSITSITVRLPVPVLKPVPVHSTKEPVLADVTLEDVQATAELMGLSTNCFDSIFRIYGTNDAMRIYLRAKNVQFEEGEYYEIATRVVFIFRDHVCITQADTQENFAGKG